MLRHPCGSHDRNSTAPVHWISGYASLSRERPNYAISFSKVERFANNTFAPVLEHPKIVRMATAQIVIKGTSHYDANVAISSGSLHSGATINLIAEPENKYDHNAVSVWLSDEHIKLGYIPRHIAAKYQSLLADNAIWSAKVRSVEPGHTPRIEVLIRYRDNPALRSSSIREWIPALPDTPGVYAIINDEEKCWYIGSSTSIRSRIMAHANELETGSHHNSPMQRDFNKQQGLRFRVTVLLNVDEAAELFRAEANAVKEAVRAQTRLYNMTDDGQGHYVSTATAARANIFTVSARGIGYLFSGQSKHKPIQPDDSPSAKAEFIGSEPSPKRVSPFQMLIVIIAFAVFEEPLLSAVLFGGILWYALSY